MKKPLFLFVLCFALFTTAFSQQDSIVNLAIQHDSLSTEKAIFKIYPLAYYTPETRIAFELFSIYSFKFKNADRLSNIRFFATYSLNKQYLFILPWQLSTSKGKYIADGRLDYRFFPDYLYGLGNETKADERELYSYHAFSFLNKGYKKIRSNFYFGAQTDFVSYRTNIDDESTLFNDANDLFGRESAQVGLIGPSVLFDSRDHVLCPHHGVMLEASVPFGIGLQKNQMVNFCQLNFDLRYFKKLNKKLVWANQLVSQNIFGEIPFLLLPKLGGPYIARGYYQGRFRDKHMHIFQTELRQDLFWRLGIVAFGSVGAVENEFLMNSVKNLKWAGGAGLRFKMSKNDRANVRLDFSFTPDSRGIYIFFAEAF